jgi:hypothetical protein
MKQIVYVSATVLAVAFVIAFYFYFTTSDLTDGGQVHQNQQLEYTPKVMVTEKCNCNDVSFLLGPFVNAPAVQPPFRPGYGPSVQSYSYTGVAIAKVSPSSTENSLQQETIAWNAAHKQAKK